MTKKDAKQKNWFLVAKSDQRRIKVRPEMILGRSETSDVQLSEGGPSRRHAKITIEDQQLFLEDLGSTNGSSINGMEISGKEQIGHNDVIKLAKEEFVVVEEVDSSDPDQGSSETTGVKSFEGGVRAKAKVETTGVRQFDGSVIKTIKEEDLDKLPNKAKDDSGFEFPMLVLTIILGVVLGVLIALPFL